MRKTAASNDDDNDDSNHNHAKTTHIWWPVSKQNEAIIKIYNLSNKAQRLMYTNQTGKFPKKSSRRYQYIMVLIKIDRNAILVKAIKICIAGEMIRAYQVLVEHLRSAGVNPIMHILDKECSPSSRNKSNSTT